MHQFNYTTEDIAEHLQQARLAQNLSQRELSRLAGVPQAHISRIERNQVDLRLSSLIAIASALGLNVLLVPHQAVPAVQSITRLTKQNADSSPHAEDGLQTKPAYTLDRADPQ